MFRLLWDDVFHPLQPLTDTWLITKMLLRQPSLFSISGLSCLHAAKARSFFFFFFFVKAVKKLKSHTAFVYSLSLIKGVLSLARRNRWQPELRHCSSDLSQKMFSVNVRPYGVDQRHSIGYSRNTLSLFNVTAS